MENVMVFVVYVGFICFVIGYLYFIVTVMHVIGFIDIGKGAFIRYTKFAAAYMMFSVAMLLVILLYLFS